MKPPFPAVVGPLRLPDHREQRRDHLRACPSSSSKGAEWFASFGVEKNGGPKLYCVSGHVKRPGIYEAPMGRITLRDLIYGEGFGRASRAGASSRP